MFHKHKFEKINFKIVPSPSFKHKLCVDVYKCTKCNKIKYGKTREMTDEEIITLANGYKKYLED